MCTDTQTRACMHTHAHEQSTCTHMHMHTLPVNDSQDSHPAASRASSWISAHLSCKVQSHDLLIESTGFLVSHTGVSVTLKHGPLDHISLRVVTTEAVLSLRPDTTYVTGTVVLHTLPAFSHPHHGTRLLVIFSPYVTDGSAEEQGERSRKTTPRARLLRL